MRRAIPILGTTLCQVELGRRTHIVPDWIVMLSLQEHLRTDFGPQWFACVMFSSGRTTLRGATYQTPSPPEEVAERMLNVAAKLNIELHGDGHWIAVWAKDRLSLLWRDGDGDAQFAVTIDEPWARTRLFTVEDLADRAATAGSEWVERMRAVERRPADTIKAAQGERPRAPGNSTVH